MELRNPVREKLLAGRPSIGAWCVSGSPISAEVMANAGFVWIVLDVAHYPIDVALAADCFRAVQLAGAMPLVRLPACDATWIKRFLDAGAMGIIIPLLRSAADARNVAQWSRFPPLGRRPFGGGRANYLYGRDEYLGGANDAILVLVQIETPEAVDDLDAILAVDGLDGCFVGPTDLALAKGLPIPWAPSDERDELVRSLARRIRAAGKVTGTVAATAQQVGELVEQGYQLVNVAGDLPYVQQASADAVAELRRLGLM